jgi:hypothetical protein
MPYLYDISEGNVPNHYPVRRFGHNDNVATSWETIGDLSALNNYLTSAEQLNVISSSVNDDGDPVGTGARTLFINGLDSNYDLQSETITLNGTTAVITTKSYLRILKAYVVTCGSAGTNVGNISIRNNAGSVNLEYISATEGETHCCSYTVPADNTVYVTGWFATESSSKGSMIAIYTRELGEAWRQRRLLTLLDSGLYIPFEVPFKIIEKTDVEVRAKGLLAGAIVSSGLIGWREL